MSNKLHFELPPGLEATEPPEARGLHRDDVRLMVSHYRDDRVEHAHFYDLSAQLEAGDLLVVNTSGTLSAAIPARRADGSQMLLHLSTRLPAGLWTVELREPTNTGSKPFFLATRGETLSLPAGGTVTLHTPYRNRDAISPRLWVASLDLPLPVTWYLEDHGNPIRYSYVRTVWPPSYYQTIFAAEPGSAEMPSAGRAFTPDLLRRLQERGVILAPLLLHTGVASLESHEPPYEEFYRVPLETAQAVNSARTSGRRVIAIGTTAARAIETVADHNGLAHPGQGWTDLMITPARGLRVVDGLLTGFHEPKATHLEMLAALCGEQHLQITYAEALQMHYLWHEFGDLHLIMP
jgi:S-adenosylmethionine:tRNA ribosyltransferase-isomerase